MLKTRRFGYDGKGQRMLRERAEGDRNALFAEFGGAPLILEGFVPFEREVSVVARPRPRRQLRGLRPLRERAPRPHPGR